jgi:hypothetical protein
MKKVTAVLRSLVLMVIVVLVLWNTPGDVFGSPDSMVQVRRIQSLWKTAWVAVGWIAVETAIAWFLALRKPKAPKVPKGGKAASPAAAEEPAAEKPSAEPKGK